MQSIKTTLDPNGILNPSKIFQYKIILEITYKTQLKFHIKIGSLDRLYIIQGGERHEEKFTSYYKSFT